MKIIQVMDAVRAFFSAHVATPHLIPSVQWNDKGWRVTVEVLEEKEYLIEHARDEIVCVYEVQVGHDMEIVSYSRKSTHPRGAYEQDE